MLYVCPPSAKLFTTHVFVLMIRNTHLPHDTDYRICETNPIKLQKVHTSRCKKTLWLSRLRFIRFSHQTTLPADSFLAQNASRFLTALPSLLSSLGSRAHRLITPSDALVSCCRRENNIIMMNQQHSRQRLSHSEKRYFELGQQ